MAFTTPSPNRPPSVHHGTGTFGKIGKGSTLKGFAESFGGVVRPSLIHNVDVSFNVGGNGSGNNSGGSGSNGKTKTGSRPHRNYGFRVPVERSTNNLTFSSGINSGLIINPFERVNQYYSDLFICSGSFFSKTVPTSIAHQLLDKLLFRDILFQCQTVIRYNVDKDMSMSSFYNYISSVVAALQLYYFVDAILAYCASSEIRYPNPGLQKIRSSFTAEILSQHTLLGETLSSFPVPRNVLEMIRYFYQNFTFTDDVNSPICRLSFRTIMYDGLTSSLSPEYYNVILDELLKENVRVPGILRKAFPSMIINELPPSSAVPIHDKNFLTFWSNNTVTFYNEEAGKLEHTRHVENTNTDFNYFSYIGDNIDGLYSSLIAIYVDESKSIEAGLWSPLNDTSKFKNMNKMCQSSLLCYSEDEANNGFTSPKSIGVLSQSGIYHGIYLNDKHKHKDAVLIPIGVNKVQTCSIEHFRQSLSETMYFLFDSPSVREKTREFKVAPKRKR
jgi:hypothetical protein